MKLQKHASKNRLHWNRCCKITELQIPLNHVDEQTSPTIVVRDITGKEVLRQGLEKGQTSVVLNTTK